MSQRLRDLKNRLEKLKNKVENLKPSENLSQSQDEVEEIDQDIQHVEEAIKDIEDEAEEDEELSNQKPFLDKFNEYKNDFDIIKNKFNKKKDEVMTAHNQELLMQGKLRGVEKKKAERDMALDQIKQIDEHELIIDGISDNIKGANTNLANMNVEAKKQREQIVNIGDKVVQMDQTVKKTGEVFDGVEKRVFCRKFMLWLGIVILLLANIVMVFLILAKGGGWPPFNSKTDNGGIDLNENVNINFDEFANNNLTFILIKAGGGTDFHNKTIDLIKAAKEKDADIGIYWTINYPLLSTDINAQVEEAKKVLNQVKTNDLTLKLGFYFKFEDDTAETIIESGKMNEYCGQIQNFECGISLKRTYYENKYKSNTGNLKNIKNYWINTEELDTTWKDEDPVKMFNIMGNITISNIPFAKLKRK